MAPIRDLAFDTVAQHSQKILLAAMLVVLLTVGAAGEAVAHNPAGHAVPGCENGADVVAEQNPNCHAPTAA
jgi:heme A synthase